MMSPPPFTGLPSPADPWRTGLHRAAVVVPLAGLIAAEGVLWNATRHPTPPTNAVDPANFKTYKGSNEYLYGGLGRVTDQLGDALQRPGPQAGLIVAVSVGIALACLVLAKRMAPADADAAARAEERNR